MELADIDDDGLVNLLFANGGDYDTPGRRVGVAGGGAEGLVEFSPNPPVSDVRQ